MRKVSRMLKFFGGLLLSVGLSGSVQADTVKVKVSDHDYIHSGQKFSGFFARPTQAPKKGKKWPGLLMVHNWMGVTDETRTQARRFAEHGYVVFAVDVYGEGMRPKSREEAAKLSMQYKTDRSLFRERIRAGLEVMSKDPDVDQRKLFAAGYCFGGTGVIELARSGAKVNGVVSFHGGLDSPKPDDGKNIKARVLALHGADDPFVKSEDLAAFESEMKSAKIKYTVVKYPGAVHSFTEKSAGNDNSKGAAYNEEADRKSFEEALKFLR